MAQTAGGMLEAARARIDRLDPSAAFAEQRDGALLIDTRCEEIRAETGIIPGSIHVRLSLLPWAADATSGHDTPAVSSDTARRVIVVDAHGYSSSLAAATLVDLGFERAADLIGGFDAWADAGLPVEPAEA